MPRGRTAHSLSAPTVRQARMPRASSQVQGSLPPKRRSITTSSQYSFDSVFALLPNDKQTGHPEAPKV